MEKNKKNFRNYPDKCRCCEDFLSINEKKLVYRWPLCSVVIPANPSVDRENGGHLILFPHRHAIKRSDLKPDEAVALMRASMIVEQAMRDVFPLLGIDLANINICDCGNLKADEPDEKRHLHWHFYGRARDNKNYSHRQFLNFPPRGSDYYKNIKPLTGKDRLLLKNRIEKLEQSPRFRFKQ